MLESIVVRLFGKDPLVGAQATLAAIDLDNGEAKVQSGRPLPKCRHSALINTLFR